MKNLVIFDVDGVVADFEGQLTLELYKKFGVVAYKNRYLFSLEDRYSENPEMLKYAQELTNDPNFYYPLSEIPGGISLVNICLRFGGEVAFVSSRPASTEKFTNRWLKKFFKPEDYELLCVIYDKVKFLEYEKDAIDFVVEDNPSNIEALKKAGFTVFAYDQEWNQGIFPRFYERMDGTIMEWKSEDVEAEPFAKDVQTIMGV